MTQNEALIYQGANSQVKVSAALEAAASEGIVETVSVLLKAAGPYSHSVGTKALSLAAERGYVPVVQCLLEEGLAFRNQSTGRHSIYSLQQAWGRAVNAGHTEVIRLLEEALLEQPNERVKTK